MEQGFIIDVTHGGLMVSQWSPGAPRKSFWTGISVDKKSLVPIGTFRCLQCGLLESYARPEFGAASAS
jgi:hypothetical protein